MPQAPYKITERRRMFGGTQSFYEATNYQARRQRRHIPRSDGDTRDNIGDWGHRELLSASRYLCENFGPIGGAIHQMASYAVGCGFNVQYRGADKKWGEAMESALYEWDKISEVRGHPYDFRTSLVNDLVSVIRDGDASFLLVDNGEGYPQFQSIPAHRVGWHPSKPEETWVINGVRVDNYGRPIAYRVFNEPSADSYVELPAKNFCLTFRPKFSDQTRGIPWLAPVILDVADLFDIRDFTKVAIKSVSSIVMVDHTDTPPNSTSPIFGGTSEAANGAPAIERLDGGTIRYVRVGENNKIEIPNDNRPSVNSMDFSFEILRGAFEALGWPIEFYNPEALGGANIRLRVAQAKRAIEGLQEIAEKIAMRKHAYAIAKLAKLGMIPPLPADWFRFEHQRPRDITVDNGRDTKADLQALEEGGMTFSEWFGRSGDDWQESMEQRVREEKYLQDLCNTAGVDINRVRPMKNPMPETPETGEQEEKPKGKSK